ncbi:MAG: hypothetical protein LBF61_02600 [Azoarcus sp.]|jgi:hypothetical protein|nr:hypothetical protein [Azoarcus sp.]
MRNELELLHALNNAVSERGISDTARRLGYSNHTLLSRILGGHIGPSANFWNRVERAFTRRHCPVMNDILTAAQCHENRQQPAPTHNPSAMQQWKTCQRCPHAMEE